MNAVKHGLRPAVAVLPGEDPAEYKAFLAGVLASLPRPAGRPPTFSPRAYPADRAETSKGRLHSGFLSNVDSAAHSRVNCLAAHFCHTLPRVIPPPGIPFLLLMRFPGGEDSHP